MNVMNILFSKSIRTKGLIYIEYSPPIIYHGHTSDSSSLPLQNRSTIPSSSKTAHSMSSKQPAVTIYVANKIEFKN